MPHRFLNRLVSGCAALALMLAGCDASDADTATSPVARKAPELAVMTSLPILWAEGGVDTVLSGENAGNWIRTVLDGHFQPVPIDRLTQLADQDFLLLAQPRALAGDENVALDEWVRGGGRALLLADPMLTAHSRYRLGDARAPQPVALLSPILGRWGLELVFDPAQSPDERVSDGPLAIPVRMAGRWQLTGQGHESTCKLSEDALVARCIIGRGDVLLVADAAFVEDGVDASESTRSAFSRVLKSAFDTAYE